MNCKSMDESTGDLFLEFFTRYDKRIRAYTYALVHDRQAAEDVFQSTALVLWRKFDQFDPESDFLAWAFRIAHYEALGYFRKARRDRLRFNDRVLATLADEGSDRYSHRRERCEALRRCLRKLSDRDRELIQRSYDGKQTVKELAECTGRAVQTLYNKLSRIRRQLFECVEKRLAGGEV